MKKSVAVKERLPKVFEPGHCDNCGRYLSADDTYCSACGQRRIGKKDRSFLHLVRESFLDYFHLDSKLWGSMRPLLFRPGFLTNEFLAGKRVKFFPPFKMFLVITVIYFLLHSVAGSLQPETRKAKAGNDGSGKFVINGLDLGNAGSDSMRRTIDSVGLKAYVDRRWHDEPGWARYMLRKTLKISMNTGQDFNTILLHNASRMVFVLIPVFALLLKLLYVRRQRLYFDHLIFSLHFHSFVFLLLTVSMFADMLYSASTTIVVILSGIYLFFALQAVYRQSRRKTFGKMILLGAGYLIVALPVFLILLAAVSLVMA